MTQINADEITIEELISGLESAPALKVFLLMLCEEYLENESSIDFKINFEMLSNALGLI